MQAALRPYATAGVALVGASVIAVSPVAVPPTAIEQVRESAVELSALVNPIDVFGPIFRDALGALQATGQTVIDNPAPILGQLIRNQFANVAGLPAAIQSQIDALPQLPVLLGDALRSELNNVGTLIGLGPTFIQNVITAITETGDFTAQASLQAALDSIANNDLGAAFSSLSQIPLQILLGGSSFGNLAVILALTPALQQPFADLQKLLPIAAGPLGNAQAAVGVLATVPLALGIGALTPVITGGTAVGNTLSEVIDAAETHDPEAAFNSIVRGSGAVTEAVLDGFAQDFGGGVLGGLLPQIQSLREQLAEAIGKTPPSALLASANALPGTTTKTLTLTAPLKEVTSTPKASTPSVDEKAGATQTGATAPVAGKDASDDAASANGGNLFTPGATSTKGGRHRAETGSFAEGLRDTIKGLTGLGREKKSDKETSGASASKSDESGSSSSGSGDSGSGGGSESK